MLLTLNAWCLREMILPSGGRSPTLTLDALPRFTREVLGLHGLYLPTALLAGADRRRLEHLREQADKAGCAVLVLVDSNVSPLGDAGKDEAAVERLKRVVEAASAVGATAITVRVEAADTQASMDRVVLNLKKISKAGESRDINVLIAPSAGLTSQPDKITEMIKKVGGFRIGTYPDLQAASTQKEPAVYLRRLTPYASALCAATVEFTEGEVAGPVKPRPRPAPEPDEDEAPAAPAAAPAKGKGKGKGKAKGPAEAEAEPERGGKKGKKAGTPAVTAPPVPAEEDEEFDEDEELTPEELLAELAPPEPAPEVPPEPELLHGPYALRPLLEAVVAVGYEGSMGIDYRGEGDATLGVIRSRKAIQRILEELG